MNLHYWIVLGIAVASPVHAQTSAPESEVGDTPAPAPPTDHAADAVFGSEQMAPARDLLRHEAGRMTSYSVLFNLAEFRVQRGRDAYRWEGEGWIGGDINRFVLKTEGEGAVGHDPRDRTRGYAHRAEGDRVRDGRRWRPRRWRS